MRMLRIEHPIAKKVHTCNACDWITNSFLGCGYDIPYSEAKEIVKARRNNWCIQPGQEYVKQISIQCGEFTVFKAIPAIHKICLKYDVYEDAC